MSEEEFWNKTFDIVWENMEQFVSCKTCIYQEECFSDENTKYCSEFLHDKYENLQSVI